MTGEYPYPDLRALGQRWSELMNGDYVMPRNLETMNRIGEQLIGLIEEIDDMRVKRIEGMKIFAEHDRPPAMTVWDDHLYVALNDGTLYRVDKDGKREDIVFQTEASK